MSIIGAAQQQDRNRVEAWTPVGKSWAKAIYVAHADNVTLESGKLATINDISGNGNHAVQTVVADQLDYTVSDSRAGGLPTFGASVNTGFRCITTPTITISRLYLVMVYGDGTVSSFTGGVAIMSGSDSFGSPYILGSSGTNSLNAGSNFAATAQKNGNTASAVVLPMPLSLVVTDSLYGSQTKAFSIGCRRSVAGTTLQGGFRSAILTTGAETADEKFRTEAWLAKNSNIESSLHADNPYK